MRKYLCKYINFHFSTTIDNVSWWFSFTPLEGNTYGIAYMGGKRAEALEQSNEFKQGLVFRADQDDVADEAADEPKVYEYVFAEVSTVQQAREVLTGEPFNVTGTKLPNKKALLEIAEELSVDFPQLKD